VGVASIKDVFSEGKIKLVFEGGGDDGKSLKIHVVNTGNAFIEISFAATVY
jgi:hypothetical protein